MSLPARSRILGHGSELPEKVLTNEDFARMVDTSDEWIFTRTGIRERRILPPGERLTVMTASACRKAMEQAGTAPEDIEALIVCTYTPERLCPSASCETAGLLGLGKIPAFDVNAACSGFMYGLQVADGLIRSGIYKRVMVAGAEAQSRYVNYQDRGTCILFGDGAGAAVVGPSDDDRGILTLMLGSDATGNEMITLNATAPNPTDQSHYAKEGAEFIAMSGREVFKFAVRAVGQALDDALETAGLSRDSVDLLVPHQANIRIIDAARERLGLSEERVVVNIERYGNTAAASIPITLDEAARSGRLKPGMTVALVGFGGGFTYGAALIRW